MWMITCYIVISSYKFNRRKQDATKNINILKKNEEISYFADVAYAWVTTDHDITILKKSIEILKLWVVTSCCWRSSSQFSYIFVINQKHSKFIFYVLVYVNIKNSRLAAAAAFGLPDSTGSNVLAAVSIRKLNVKTESNTSFLIVKIIIFCYFEVNVLRFPTFFRHQ